MISTHSNTQKRPRLYFQLLSEFLGTFIMVLIGTGGIVLNVASGNFLGNFGIGLSFGFGVFIAIFFFKKISGAHINPAVTMSLVLMRYLPPVRMLPYWLAQLSGAAFASAVLYLIVGDKYTLGETIPSGSSIESLFLEICISAGLMTVIFIIALRVRASDFLVGIAVGVTVGTIAAFWGPISGASMNPARSFGPALIAMNFSHHWLYWLGPCVGCLLTALVIHVTHLNKQAPYQR